jgi:hypothetical protein
MGGAQRQRDAARHHKRCDVEALPRRIPAKEGLGVTLNSRTYIQNPTDHYIRAQATPTKPIFDDLWRGQFIAGKRPAECCAGFTQLDSTQKNLSDAEFLAYKGVQSNTPCDQIAPSN